MAEKTVHAIVEGRVQGVFYRASTQEEAQRIGVNGWVRNRADGSVEVLVTGDADRVDRLIGWLSEGPPMSQVSRVSIEEQGDSASVFNGFEIRY